MSTENIPKLSAPELDKLRYRAAKGDILTPDEVRLFVAATRKSYLAVPSASREKTSRDKKPAVDEKQIDFF